MQFSQLNRRELIALLGGTAAAWPLAVRAQQSAIPVIGFLRNTSRHDSVELLAAMRQGLKQAGFVEGNNLAVEYRYADSQLDRLPALAADLVHRQVALIIAGGNASSLAAKAATTTIPVVFSTGDEPVQIGLVSSLGRPGGNVTGVSFFSSTTLAGKRLDLLHEVVPKVDTIAYLMNPNNPFEHELRELRKTADALGLKIFVVSAGSDSDIEAAFARLAQERAGALLISSDSWLNSLRERLIALSARQALPTMYLLREFTAAGGLMSYGASMTEAYRQAGIYAGGILKGAQPAELPIVLPSKFELVINLTTAKALGIDVPLSLLIRADEMID
jgi:putative ABC transport system substrate-binding protein